MISVQISRKELLAHSPCHMGRELFEAMVRLQGRDLSVKVHNWTPLHTVWLACAYPDFASWLREKGLIPLANLRWANLGRAYRYSADPAVEGWRVDNGVMVRATSNASAAE